MSLWAIRFLGEADGTFWFTAAVSVSVLLNAAVSPILGAMSDRVGRRKPFLAVFTAAVHRRHRDHRLRRHPARARRLRGRQLRLPGRAHLLRRPAARRGRPIARGRLSGIGVGARLLRHAPRRGPPPRGVSTDADGESTAATFVLVAGLFAVFAAPLFLVVTERDACRHAVPRGRCRPVLGAARRRRSGTRARRRACCASSSRASSTPIR